MRFANPAHNKAPNLFLACNLNLENMIKSASHELFYFLSFRMHLKFNYQLVMEIDVRLHCEFDAVSQCLEFIGVDQGTIFLKEIERVEAALEKVHGDIVFFFISRRYRI